MITLLIFFPIQFNMKKIKFRSTDIFKIHNNYSHSYYELSFFFTCVTYKIFKFNNGNQFTGHLIGQMNYRDNHFNIQQYLIMISKIIYIKSI